MKVTGIITALSLLIAILAAGAAAIGLFWTAGGNPFSFTTLHGQTTVINGQGIYYFDTQFTAAGYKGQDAVALFLGVPLLVIRVILYQRGKPGHHLLLVGTLGYFLYLYACMALGAAYNRLFLVYLVLFSASLYAFILAFSSVDLESSASQIIKGTPRRSLAVFMGVAGCVTLVVWGVPLVLFAPRCSTGKDGQLHDRSNLRS